LPTIPAYINNIFYNLISNGIKFRKKDVNPVIEIYTRLQNNIPMILFKDNGIGINLKKHGDKLFQPYKRFELSTQGKGLGLHITRTQIEAMGGHIEIESEPGKGTTFKVHFPITNEKHTTTNPENKEVME
ncbi:MAG TPA: ATP-binding protein, partial [Cytophagaceae bacterium]